MAEPVVYKTAAPGVVRKLATILSADVAGYSRLMAADEEQTLLTFRGHSEVFEQLVALHRGRIFNRAGDAILAEFDSVVAAVRCATDIQAALQTRNAMLPEDRQVRFRIGINLGDVMVQGEDLLGDGVNLAARLQTAAEPGGICLSGSVYDQIRNKLSLSFKPLGELSFKNIPQAVRTFSIAETDGQGTLPVPPSARRPHGKFMTAALVLVLLVAGAAGSWSLWRRADVSLAAPATPAVASAPAATTGASLGAGAANREGVYAGPICYGQGPNDGPRCFRAEAKLEQGHLVGRWAGREGNTMVLEGTVSAEGEVKIEMHTERADGARQATIELAGKLQDGLMAANGSFRNGRTATLEWRRE